MSKYQAGKRFKNIYNFSTLHQRYGVLKVFDCFYPDHPFQESFNEIEDIIYNLPIDESDVAKHKKMLHDNEYQLLCDLFIFTDSRKFTKVNFFDLKSIHKKDLKYIFNIIHMKSNLKK